jgi:hypothetical protein
MTNLSFESAILLAVSFAAGALATWLFQDHRARAERRRFEQEMLRVLEARYQAYEGLEREVRAFVGTRSGAPSIEPGAPLPARESAPETEPLR